MNQLLELYWTFVKIGCVTFGGLLPVKLPAAALVLLSGAAGLAVSLRRAARSGKGGEAK